MLGMPTKAYTKADVKRFTSVRDAQFTRWTDIGLIPANIAAADGKGSERLFSFRDVFYFALAVQLYRLGVTTKTTKELLGLWDQSVALAMRASQKDLKALQSKLSPDALRQISLGAKLRLIEHPDRP